MMGVTMRKRIIDCFETVYEHRTEREVAAEAVVPDTMPDIDRILCADGNVMIRSKESGSDNVVVRANVSATVLYVPEGGESEKLLKTNVNFDLNLESEGVTDDGECVAQLRLVAVEARILNPRKVLVRCVVECCVECYERGYKEYIEGVTCEDTKSLHVKTETEDISHVVAVKEKTFVVADEYAVPQGKGEIETVEKCRVELICDEVKPVGRRLVVNGRARVCVLYRVRENMDLCYGEYETVFSQLVDAETELSAPEAAALLMLTAEYIEPTMLTNGERGISCEIHALVQVVCTDSSEVCYVSDMYSNTVELEVRTAEEQYFNVERKMQIRCGVHEEIEIGEAVSEVLCSQCRISELKEADGQISCKANLTAMCKLENGGYRAVSKKIDLKMQAECEDGIRVFPISAACNSSYASCVQQGVDIRFNVDVSCFALSGGVLKQVVEAEVGEEDRPNINLPSLIVLKAVGDECLWDLAKRCRSTCEIIMEANKMENEDITAGRVLVVPLDK